MNVRYQLNMLFIYYNFCQIYEAYIHQSYLLSSYCYVRFLHLHMRLLTMPTHYSIYFVRKTFLREETQKTSLNSFVIKGQISALHYLAAQVETLHGEKRTTDGNFEYLLDLNLKLISEKIVHFKGCMFCADFQLRRGGHPRG